MTSGETSGEDTRSSVRGPRFPVMVTVALLILLSWSLAATLLFLNRDAALRLSVNMAASRRYQDELAQRLKLTEQQLAEMRATQEQLLERFGDLARGRIGQMEKIIATTGLDAYRLVPPRPGRVVKPAAKLSPNPLPRPV